ncbi:MAG TPA: AraC family transcriptional regulator [Xanthobacteraceae bacterium]
MSAPQSIRLSTDHFPGRDWLEATREMYGRAIMKVDFEPLPDIPFHIDLTLRALPGVGLASGTASPMNCFRPARLIESDDLILVVALSGNGTFRVSGREADIGAGTAVLTSAQEIGRFDIHSAVRLINFRLPCAKIAPLIAGLGSALMRPIPDNGALRLMINYLDALPNDDALSTPELTNLVATHIHDLAALAIGATRDAAVDASRRGLRAARLAAIKADVLEHLAGADLSIAAVAARQGVTPRYVHALFEAEPLTFSEFVLAQRLARAHRMLNDPRFAARPIHAVAVQAGFGDLRHFNRTFRRLYGATPSTVREIARRDRT